MRCRPLSWCDMAERALTWDGTEGRMTWTEELVHATDATFAATAHGIPRANSNNVLHIDWLPVAADGVNDSSSLVRADDSRLSNPPLGGDLSGTAAAAVVIKIQGRDFANISPADGDVPVWNASSNRWEPEAGGGGGSALTISDGSNTVNNVTQINVDTVTDEGGGTVSIAAGSGGGTVPPGLQMYLYRTFH